MLPEFNSLCVCCAHLFLFLFLYSAALLASLHYAQMMNHYRGLVMVIGVLIRLGYLFARASTILFQLGF